MGKRAEGRIRDGAIDGREEKEEGNAGPRTEEEGRGCPFGSTDRLSLSAGHISIFE